uniref:Ig-like domain-containing protein n=1 Tax=Anopheles atroparvus TaxID=41427 RepID=A0A182JMY2_ANOAO
MAPRGDIENIPVVKYVAVAGKNITLDCPGVNERSLVETLVWRTSHTIAEYINGLPLVSNPRLTLIADNFSLQLSPSISSDTAEYSCLLNDRHSPEAIVDLLVQGEYKGSVPQPRLPFYQSIKRIRN